MVHEFRKIRNTKILDCFSIRKISIEKRTRPFVSLDFSEDSISLPGKKKTKKLERKFDRKKKKRKKKRINKFHLVHLRISIFQFFARRKKMERKQKKVSSIFSPFHRLSPHLKKTYSQRIELKCKFQDSPEGGRRFINSAMKISRKKGRILFLLFHQILFIVPLLHIRR